MLYDPKWEQTKADPYSLANLISWLEKQPSDKEYEPHLPWVCLLGQFVQAMGVNDKGTTSNRLAKRFGVIAFGPSQDQIKPDCWTFGAALTRARAALADEK